MLPRNHPDRIQITFDDRRLVANAGLLLPATLARRLGLPELVRQRLDLGDAPGRANTGDKLMTLVASAMAGGDCIDDADVLRTGGTACTLGGTVKAPSTLGTFLRSFRWGHVRQLDRVSRQLLARAWAAGAGPGDGPLTIDLDSTICETYGLAKEGARHHGYTGKRGYHPLLAIAAGTGDVLMSRLREGRQHRPRRRPLPVPKGKPPSSVETVAPGSTFLATLCTSVLADVSAIGMALTVPPRCFNPITACLPTVPRPALSFLLACLLASLPPM